MGCDPEKQLIKDVFSKERWVSSLERFIQVLRINIFVSDGSGLPIIHPCGTSWGEEYGCRILTRLLGIDGIDRGKDFLKQFLLYGEYLEYRSRLGLHVFAVPLKIYDRAAAYMIVGPVIMNKRLPDQDYLTMAKKENVEAGGLLDELRGIRAVSYVAMGAILDLLSAISRDFIEIGLENRRLRKLRFQKEILPEAITETAENLYKEIHVDELLISVLDVALRLTGAEGGSVMVLDKDAQEMMIRVSRGLSDEYVKMARVRLGEGVSGIAAEENQCFFIRGEGTDGMNRLKPFLKRPDIKESMVVPISHHNRVFGVLNLHSKNDESHIEANAGDLIRLSKLLSAAVFS